MYVEYSLMSVRVSSYSCADQKSIVPLIAVNTLVIVYELILG